MDEALRQAQRRYEEEGDVASGLRVVLAEVESARDALFHPWLDERALRLAYGEVLAEEGDALGDRIAAGALLEGPDALSASEEAAALRRQHAATKRLESEREAGSLPRPARVLASEELPPWRAALDRALEPALHQNWALAQDPALAPKAFGALRSVHLSGEPHLRLAPPPAPCLRSLSLSSVGWEQEVLAPWFAHYGDQLRELSLGRRACQPMPLLESLSTFGQELPEARELPALTRLTAYGAPCEQVLPYLRRLRELWVGRGVEASQWAESPHLVRLSLTRGDWDLSFLPRLPSLRSLAVLRVELEPQQLTGLRTATPLRGFSYRSPYEEVEPEALQSALQSESLSGLREFSIRASDALTLSALGAAPLASLVRLSVEELTPALCQRLSELGPLENLTHLSAESIPADVAPFAADLRAALPGLVSLHCWERTGAREALEDAFGDAADLR